MLRKLVHPQNQRISAASQTEESLALESKDIPVKFIGSIVDKPLAKMASKINIRMDKDREKPHTQYKHCYLVQLHPLK